MKRKRFHHAHNWKDLQDLDLRIAVEIAGFAGVEVRDRKGNLSTDVWVRHSDKMSVGKLIESSDLRQLLLDQLKQHLEQQKDLVEQLEDDKVVINWILKFITTWEDAYQDRVNKNFDIAQKILTAMHEAVVGIKYTLQECGIDWSELSHKVDELGLTDHNVLPTEEALVRFVFRNEMTGPCMRRLAGKILQKNIVCNKAGTYSAKVQRNDVTQEKANALRDVIIECQTQNTFTEALTLVTDAECKILLYNSHMTPPTPTLETSP